MSTIDYLLRHDIQVVGLSGRAGCGKDYLADRSAIPWGFLPMALANHFKVEAVAKDGLDLGAAFWREKSPSERALLQRRGTEEGREVYGDDIWLRHAEAWMCYYVGKGFRRFCLTDIRFVNEVLWLQSLGGKVYRVTGRGGVMDPGNRVHRSETELDGYLGFDRVFDNSVENEGRVISELLEALHLDFPSSVYGRHYMSEAWGERDR